MSHNCEYVRQHYQVPAEIGRRVIAYGKPGVILADRGHYIGVVLDEDTKKRISNYHPTHEMQYGEMAERFRSKSGWSCRSSMTGMTSTGTGRPAKIW